MSGQPPDATPRRQWESVHRCPNCGYVINLEDIDLRVIGTGIITCPKCDWSGVVKIEVIEVEPPPG